MASFLLPIICCSIVPTKNTERDAAIKKLLKRNGAGPGHQLTPQTLPGSEVVTINPNNGKNKDMQYIHQYILLPASKPFETIMNT